MSPSLPYAGFWRRLVAYLIDAIPITIAVALILGPLIGLPDAYRRYSLNRRDPQARMAFLEKRNMCRNVAATSLVLYGTACEGSPMQGTLGKLLMRMHVRAVDGGRLGFGGAFVRNVCKLLSLLPAFIGCIWAAFDRRKQAWHDKVGRSVVVLLPPRPLWHDALQQSDNPPFDSQSTDARRHSVESV